MLTLKVSTEEREDWESRAGDRPLGEWIRSQCNGAAARIEVSPDEGDWHWVAYDRDDRVLSCGGLESGPQLERRVRRAADEHGVRGVEDAAVTIES